MNGRPEFSCGVCDEPMEFDRVREGNDGPVVESEVFECENGHRGVRNYGPLGYSIQSINLKKAVTRKELVADGGVQVEIGDCVETADESIACPNGRGDCPGVVPKIEDINLVAQCPDCCEKSWFPDGEPEEVDGDD